MPTRLPTQMSVHVPAVNRSQTNPVLKQLHRPSGYSGIWVMKIDMCVDKMWVCVCKFGNGHGCKGDYEHDYRDGSGHGYGHVHVYRPMFRDQCGLCMM